MKNRHSSVIAAAALAAVAALAVVVTVGENAAAQQAPAAPPGVQPGARVGGPFPRQPPQPVPTEPRVIDSLHAKIRVVPMVSGLAAPWSMAFLPNGDMLVTEKVGRLRVVRGGKLDPAPITGTPQVFAMGQGGLLEVSLHPQYAQNQFIYLTFSKPGPNNTNTTALMRARYDGGSALIDAKEIFVAEAWRDATAHFGSRIAWGRDGMLYMTVGERNDRTRAQDTTNHAGKVLRLKDDGTVPPDNPFVGRAGFRPEIYSYGHRNMQGLAFHPETGQLFETEHGPQGGDELNLIQGGKNYGWPVVTFGREYSGETINVPFKEGMEGPVTVWVPSIALSGMVFYTGDKFPGWKGSLFVGGLAGLQLHRVVFGPGGPQGRETLLNELKVRVRDVRQGPDGLLYLAIDANPNGAILRLEPADAPVSTSASVR